MDFIHKINVLNWGEMDHFYKHEFKLHEDFFLVAWGNFIK